MAGCPQSRCGLLQTQQGNVTTLRDRRTDWLAAGVFDKLVEEALAGYDRIIGLDLSEVGVDDFFVGDEDVLED